MGAVSRRQQQKAELRGLILEAARTVFVREGHEQMTMRRLAGEIEYSPGTIYLHFQNKAELLDALVEESFAKLSAVLATTVRPDPLEALHLGLRAYVEFGLQHPHHYHFAFLLQRQPSGPYRPHAAFEFLRARARCCIEAGKFRPADAEMTAQLLWATVHGVTSLLITRPQFPWVDRERLVEETIGTAIRGLLSVS